MDSLAAKDARMNESRAKLDGRLNLSFEIIQILWWQALASIFLKRAEKARERLRLHLVEQGAKEAVAQSHRGARRLRWGYATLSEDQSYLSVRVANPTILKLLIERAEHVTSHTRIGDAQLNVVDTNKDETQT